MNKVILQNNVHSNLTIDLNRVELLAEKSRLIPIVLSEFQHLATQYPVVFSKSQDTGKFECVVLLGLNEVENLFVDSDGWKGLYVPLNVRRQPFFLGDADGEDPVVCVDSDSNCIGSDYATPLFEGGVESEYLENIKSILAELWRGKNDNVEFMSTLTELDLIMPLSLKVTLASGKEFDLEGLFTIDEYKFKKLSGSTLKDLLDKNYLKHIYSMIISLGQIYSLIDRKNKKDSLV